MFISCWDKPARRIFKFVMVSFIAGTGAVVLAVPCVKGEGYSTATRVNQGGIDASAGVTEMQSARAAVRANPNDPKVHFALAQLLAKVGRYREAAQEYLQCTELFPENYVAFHHLATLNCDSAQIEEAVARLNKLKDEKPKELMLRVALSELLEKQGNHYQAARVLVDIVYQNAVPAKFQGKVNARIHYLLAKAKDSQSVDDTSVLEDGLDTLLPPLPDTSLRNDLAQSKLKESPVTRGVGNAPLLP